MMIKPSICVVCGKPKKTRQGTKCHLCLTKSWTTKEETLLALLYPMYPSEFLAAHFSNHSLQAIKNKAYIMGLKKRYPRGKLTFKGDNSLKETKAMQESRPC